MIDIHCHILPGLDDGAKTIEESIKMVKNAYNAGVTDIILTPHFILDSTYSHEISKEESILNHLRDKIKEEGINVNLYLGNEVFVENNLYDLLVDKKFLTLAKSRYLLFEFSLDNFYQGIYDLLFKLNSNKIKPVIAHPERYSFFQNNPELIEKLYKHGTLFQLDAASFYGKYGKAAKKLFTLIVKHHYASFIASDAHHSDDKSYEKMNNLNKDLLKLIDANEIQMLVNDNPYKVINNKDIRKYKTIPFKKTILNKWK